MWTTLQGAPGARLAFPLTRHHRPASVLGFWRHVVTHRGAAVGLGVLVGLAGAALFGPALSDVDPIRITPDQLQPPGWTHPLGTDQLGRDVLARLLHGGRLSLQVALVTMSLAGCVGVGIGLGCGYAGGKLDLLVMRLVDILQAFPSILMVMALVATLGPNLQNAELAVSISAIPAFARVTRGTVLSTKTLLYVEAARVVGSGPGHVMLRHILPNVLAPVLVLATTGAGLAITASASLGFLGLGAPPPTPEWGAMLNDGRNFLRLAWWMGTFPGLAIMLMVLGVNLLGDGLRDALDPRLRG